MKSTSVSLGAHFTSFIDAQVQLGRYGSTSEVISLLEEHDLKLKSLQDALIAGEESGTPAPFGSESFLMRMRVKHEG